MDKAELIAKVAQDGEDRLLLARILDKYQQSQRRNIPVSTEFLSPREQAMAEAVLRTAGVRSGYAFDGGYEAAERKILRFLPDWAEGEQGELAFLRADFHGPDSALTHRDILGSLMGLGVARERVLSSAFSMSRGRAAELIAAGRVSLDHVPCVKGDKLVSEGSVLSVRGLGRAKLTEVGGLSRKGRTGITIERYL